jgi:MraZ protein
MINVVGTYECKIDSKARVTLPSALKKQLSPILSNGFIIKRSVFSNCLELHPLNEWNSLMLEINKLNRFIKKNNDFIRLFTAGVKSLEADSLSRLQLPKDLVSFAGIKKDIVLSSSVNMIEIWDKEKYEKELEFAIPDFAKLAEDVMGDTQKLD